MIKTLALGQIRPRTEAKLSFFKLIGLARQRHTLAALDDHMLKDIGITRAQAQTEADRPVWDAPSNWMR